MSFSEFWPRYLDAHRDPRTRLFHTVGTIAAGALVLGAVVMRKPWMLAAGLLAGYGPAWFSHAVFERNRPETFRAPAESLAADFVMAWHVLRGTIDQQLSAQREE